MADITFDTFREELNTIFETYARNTVVNADEHLDAVGCIKYDCMNGAEALFNLINEKYSLTSKEDIPSNESEQRTEKGEQTAE